MQALSHPVCTFVSDHVVITVVRHTKLTGTLTENLLNEALLRCEVVLFALISLVGGLAPLQSIHTDTCPHLIDLGNGLIKTTTLCQTLGIHQQHLVVREIDPLGVLAIVLLTKVVFDDAIARGEAGDILLRDKHIAVLIDIGSVLTFVLATNPELIDITLGLASGPVQRESLTADNRILIKTRVSAGGLLCHLTTGPLIEQLSLITTNLTVQRVNSPIKGSAIAPREHLDILLSGAVGMTERTIAASERSYKVSPLVRSLLAGLTRHTGAVDDLTASLINIAHTIGLAIVLGLRACGLVQLIPVAIGFIRLEEVLTGSEGTLPAALLEATVPDDMILLCLRRTVIIRLV